MKRVYFLIFLGILFAGIQLMWDAWGSPGPMSDVAIGQMERSDESAVEMRALSNAKNQDFMVLPAVWLLTGLFLYREELKGLFCDEDDKNDGDSGTGVIT